MRKTLDYTDFRWWNTVYSHNVFRNKIKEYNFFNNLDRVIKIRLQQQCAWAQHQDVCILYNALHFTIESKTSLSVTHRVAHI